MTRKKLAVIVPQLTFLSWLTGSTETAKSQVYFLLEERVFGTCSLVTTKHFKLHGMGNLYYRPNFNPGKMNKIFCYSSKEHLQISRIAKFGCEMLQIEENIASRSLRISIQMYYARKSLLLFRQN